jgi:spermidine synthase
MTKLEFDKAPTLSNGNFVDFEDEGEGHYFRDSKIIVAKTTRFQKLEILTAADFGKMLVLDGALQSVEDDEYIYHEALVQPALCAHPAPRRVLIIGGGEGATAREALLHASVERVTMVDLDGEVVALCREHLPSWHQGAFESDRVELVIGDGRAFVESGTDTYDVIVIDVVDAFDGGPAEALYTTDFYRAVKARLAPGGILVVQAMECGVNAWEDHRRVRANLAPVFAFARTAAVFVPTFWSDWGFVFASDTLDLREVRPDVVDRVIAERELAAHLEFYDGYAHQRLFSLSKDLRRILGGT